VSLPGLSLRRPVATAMLFLGIAVVGGVSFSRLPIDLLPDISFPSLSVWTSYPDAGPSEVERYVTEPIEQALYAVPGAAGLTSRSQEGQSLVTLRFAWGADMEFAALHTRERLDNLIDRLPQGTGRPTILRSDPASDPIMTLAVSGADLRTLKQLSDAVLRRRLEQLEGVSLASVTGGPEREILVTADPARLDAHGVSLAALTDALDAANYDAPGGVINRGRFEYSLRTLGQFESIDQFLDVVVHRTRAGQAGGPPALVRLRDVATVSDTIAELQTIARFNGEPTLGLQIFKEGGSNTVRVAERVAAAADQLREEFPALSIAVASSQARFIRDAIANVVSALMFGAVLAFLVLFLFLRDARYPAAVATAIPLSVTAAFGLCYWFDVSLNIMSLGGLALGVGLLVDNSIVVLENIFRWREQEGAGRFDSAAGGASEVGPAITASTLTTIAVFGPVVYVEGVAGALFGDLSLTVAFSLLASLLVALTLLPVIVHRVALRGGAPVLDERQGTPGDAPQRARDFPQGFTGMPGAAAFLADFVGRTLLEGLRGVARLIAWLAGPIFRLFDRMFDAFAFGYEKTLSWSLGHRPTVLLLALASLVGAVLAGQSLPRSLMPVVDERQFRAEITLPRGTPLAETDRVAAAAESAALELDGVAAVFTRVGRAQGTELQTHELTGLNSAALDVEVAAGGPPSAELIARFRERLAGAGVTAGAISFNAGRATSLGRALALGDADLAVRVQTGEIDQLADIARQVANRLEALPQLADVRVDFDRTQPELLIEVDREAAARHGIAVSEVANAIEQYLRGAEAATFYSEFQRKVTIRAVIPEQSRADLSSVLALRLRGVPIGELVEVSQGFGPVEIRRENQSRTVQVLANVVGVGLAEAAEAARAAVVDVPRPPLTTVQVGGRNEEMQRSFASLQFAFGLALALVFLIMAAQFESVVQPLVVLAAVPLAAAGAVFALWITGGGINAMSGIGMVILIGIVVNDAIIKVDFINRRRREGKGKREAIMEAGKLRLRPIIMTTATTVSGLIPLALGIGAGADLRAPLAVAVIGGLLSATFLTLLVVPVVYSLAVNPGVSVGRESHT